MRNLIIRSILKGWGKFFMECQNIRYTYKNLAFAIVNLSTMLDILKIENPHIILIGKNSFNWIVVYLTAIIKGIPLTLIPSTFDDTYKSSYINDSLGNIVISDDFKSFKPLSNRFVNVFIKLDDFQLWYIRKSAIDYPMKKMGKWHQLYDIKNNSITPELFEKFKGELKHDNFHVYSYTAGVSNPPSRVMNDTSLILRVMKGMERQLLKAKLRKKNISIQADFASFHAITFLPVLGITGQITDVGANAVIAGTDYYESMWDYTVSFMTEKQSMYLERWFVTRWINTIRLRKEYRKYFLGLDEKLFILNDETHTRLKPNLQRIGFEVFSTYGTAQSGQLVAINGRVIKDVKIRIDTANPEKNPGNLLVTVPTGSLAQQMHITGDVAYIGKNSELIIHGKRSAQIITPSQQIIYPEEIENGVRAYELVDQCIVFEHESEGIVLGASFKQFAIDARGMTMAEVELLLNEIKEDINGVLPTELNLDTSVLLARPVKTNEQGKIIRWYYKHTPLELGL